MGLFLCLPFTTRLVHFLTVVVSATSRILLQLPKISICSRVNVHIRPWLSGPTGAINNVVVRSTVFEPCSVFCLLSNRQSSCYLKLSAPFTCTPRNVFIAWRLIQYKRFGYPGAYHCWRYKFLASAVRECQLQLRPLYPRGNSTQFGGPQSRFGRFGEGKNLCYCTDWAIPASLN